MAEGLTIQAVLERAGIQEAGDLALRLYDATSYRKLVATPLQACTVVSDDTKRRLSSLSEQALYYAGQRFKQAVPVPPDVLNELIGLVDEVERYRSADAMKALEVERLRTEVRRLEEEQDGDRRQQTEPVA